MRNFSLKEQFLPHTPFSKELPRCLCGKRTWIVIRERLEDIFFVWAGLFYFYYPALGERLWDEKLFFVRTVSPPCPLFKRTAALLMRQAPVDGDPRALGRDVF